MPTWLWIALGVGVVWLLGKKSAAAPAPGTPGGAPAVAVAQTAYLAALQAQVAAKCGAVQFNAQPVGVGVEITFKGKDGTTIQVPYPDVATAEKYMQDLVNLICVESTAVAGFGRCCG